MAGETIFIENVQVAGIDAKTIHDEIVRVIKARNVDMHKVIGLDSDGAAVSSYNEYSTLNCQKLFVSDYHKFKIYHSTIHYCNATSYMRSSSVYLYRGFVIILSTNKQLFNYVRLVEVEIGCLHIV